MPEQDFELYLSLLGKLLKLNPEQTASIRDELRDHLEERLEELAAAGVDKPAAIRQALDEFGDAASLADEFAKLAQQRRRRRMLRWTLAGSMMTAAAVLLTFAFWPIEGTGPTPVFVQADDVAVDVAPQQSVAPQRDLFLDVTPQTVDRAAFVPEPLTKPNGEEGLLTTIAELPTLLRESGVTVIIDEPRLNDESIQTDQRSWLLGSGEPLYLVLDRALAVDGLDWFWDRGVLHISTLDHCTNRLSTRQHVVRDLLQMMSGDELIDVIQASAGHEDLSPWLDHHGTGGTLVLVDDVLSVRQTRRGHLEVEALLAGLADPQAELWLGEPQTHVELRAALDDVELPLTLSDESLASAIARLQSETGLPFGIDTVGLDEMGTSAGETTVSLDVPARPLGQLLDLLLSPHDLASIVENGQILVTTTEYANEALRTVLYDVRDIAADVRGSIQLVDAIQTQTGNDAYGPWLDTDGIGGTIDTPMQGVLVVRQTERVHTEIQTLLRDVRAAAASRPPEVLRDPNEYETRFYRLPTAMAQDMIRTVPRRIARGEWNEPLEELIDPTKGTLEVVSAGAFWKEFPQQGGFGGGGLGGGGVGVGGYGGGGFGGGFFQFAPVETLPGADPASGAGRKRRKKKGEAADGDAVISPDTNIAWIPSSDPLASFDSVLIVRHRVGVHTKLQSLLNRLLFGDAEGSLHHGTVPTGVLPEA